MEAPWIANDLVTPFPVRRREPDGRSWFAEDEGALSLDVFEYADAIVVRAPIAGVRPADLDLALHHDMLTIRGKRTDESAGDGRRALHEECHWGPFSRSVILPAQVRAEEAQATLVDGILTIRLPKAFRNGTIPIVGA